MSSEQEHNEKKEQLEGEQGGGQVSVEDDMIETNWHEVFDNFDDMNLRYAPRAARACARVRRWRRRRPAGARSAAGGGACARPG